MDSSLVQAGVSAVFHMAGAVVTANPVSLVIVRTLALPAPRVRATPAYCMGWVTPSPGGMCCLGWIACIPVSPFASKPLHTQWSG